MYVFTSYIFSILSRLCYFSLHSFCLVAFGLPSITHTYTTDTVN